MKNLATSYTYNPVAKTLTLTALNVPLSYLLLVVNATRGTIIYNLADPALAAANFVQAANSVLTLNASVDTSFHNASDALTIFYDDGIQSTTVLIQGPAGPQGETGDPGSTTWAGITDKPATFAPSAHKSTHATGGSDAIAPSDIGAQSIFAVETLVVTADQTLTASRAKNYNLQNYGNGPFNLTLPIANNMTSDVVVIRVGGTFLSNVVVRQQNHDGTSGGPQFTTRATLVGGGGVQQYRFLKGDSNNYGGWALVPVDTHTHAIADTTGLQTALDAKASTSALAALEARVLALEAAQP